MRKAIAYVVFGRMLLTDLLDTPPKLRKWFFNLKSLDLHDGIHEYCPGWCPCDVDFGDEEAITNLAVAV